MDAHPPGSPHEHDYVERDAKANERIAHALEHLCKILDQVYHNPVRFVPLEHPHNHR